MNLDKIKSTASRDKNIKKKLEMPSSDSDHEDAEFDDDMIVVSSLFSLEA